ncbi:hypothetical protein OXX79_002314 [Metschnikowia pulcherrima]
MNSTSHASHLAEFQECLKQSKRIIALVGAGLSASSGLPTFRGSQGLWKNFNMIDLATPDAFYIDPGLVWQFYAYRRHQALLARPNQGHFALAKLSKSKDKEFVTITQNVDGLSARAGHQRGTLYEIHGSLFDLKCTSFTCTFVDRGNEDDPLTDALDTFEEYESGSVLNKPAKYVDSEVVRELSLSSDESCIGNNNQPSLELPEDSENPAASPQFTPTKELREDQLPKCPACGSLMRPGVVWFGESLPLRVLAEIDDFLETGPVDLILVIGTSGTVYPANSYVDLVRSRGGSVAIFNTDIEPGVLEGKINKTWGFQGDAAEWLPKALACINMDE